jgi:arylsulfatase
VSFNRKQKRFELKAGVDLGQDAAPYVVKKQITIVAALAKPGSQGVIVAQGGTAHGYALYLRDGLLEFATRHSGKLTVLTARQPLADEAVEITAHISTDGTVRVMAGQAVVIEGKVPGPMVAMPQDGLQVGRDLNGAVGRYEAPAVFDGQIKQVVIEVAK